MELSFGGRLRKKVNYKEIDRVEPREGGVGTDSEESDSEESDSQSEEEAKNKKLQQPKIRQKTLDFSKFKHSKAENMELQEVERGEANRKLRLSRQRRENERRGATVVRKAKKRNHSSSEENWSESSLESDRKSSRQGTRRSTRNANAEKNYKEYTSEEEAATHGGQSQQKEDLEDEESESSEDGGGEDLPNKIDQLLGYRNSSTSADGVEWFVKWKKRAYIHSSWIPTSEVLGYFGGLRRMAHFRKKEEDGRNGVQGADIDGKFYNPNFDEAERVIAMRDREDGQDGNALEYLVLWRSLPYDQATWEEAKDIPPGLIDRFLKFQQPPTKEELKVCMSGYDRPPAFTNFDTGANPVPPFREGHELRSYQLEGLNWLAFNWHNGRNSLLADEMGLGKTVQTVSFCRYLLQTHNIRGPFLVVAPLSTTHHWKREFESWTDMNVVLCHGNAEAREMIHKHEFFFPGKRAVGVYKFNVLITTYETAMQEAQILSRIPWKVVAVDEAHRLKNRSSRLYIELLNYIRDYCILLTGTPIQNNLTELYTLLSFLHPEIFGDVELEDFTNQYGKLEGSTQVDSLHTLLKPYLLRRMKNDVEASLLPRQETLIEIDLTSAQKQYYKAIFEKNAEFLTGNAVSSLTNIGMELRKVCNHPFLITGVEEALTKGLTNEETMQKLISACGKLELLDKLLAKLKTEGHRVLIFSQMTRMLDLLEDFMRFRGHLFERIDGGVTGNARQAAIDRFSKPDSDRFVFLLCTRAGGVGINLTAADTVVIYDSDWNPQNDIQAQARCHRIGQTQKVQVYRLITRNTYESSLFQSASMKLGLDKAVLHSMAQKVGQNSKTDVKMNRKEIETLLKKGAYHIFTETESEGSNTLLDIEQILARDARVLNTGQGSDVSLFSKATFIPKEGAATLDIQDPNFWTNLGLNPQKQEVDDTGPRSRKAVQRWGMRNFDDPGSDSDEGDSSESDDDEMESKGSKKRVRRELIEGTEWTRSSRAVAWRNLASFGFGRSELWKQDAALKHKSKEAILAFECGVLAELWTWANKGGQNGEENGRESEPSLGTKVVAAMHSQLEKVTGKEALDPLLLLKHVKIDPCLSEANFSASLQGKASRMLLHFERLLQLQQALLEVKFQDVTTREAMNAVHLEVPIIAKGKLTDAWTLESDKSLLLSLHLFGEVVADDPRFAFPAELPSKALLEKRFRSLLTVMFRQATTNKRKKARSSDAEWSAKERTQLFNVVMSWPLPTNEEGWDKLATLFSRSGMEVRAHSERFLEMCKGVVTDKQNKTKEENPSAAKHQVSATRAQKVLDRQQLLVSVRAAMENPKEVQTTLNSVVKKTGLPKWWVVGKDDFLLLVGISAHGFLNWEPMLKDSNLFRAKLPTDILPKERLVEDRLRYLVKFLATPKPPALPELKPEPVSEDLSKESTEKVFDIFKKRKYAASPCKASQPSPTKAAQPPLSPSKATQTLSPTKIAQSMSPTKTTQQLLRVPKSTSQPLKLQKPPKKQRKMENLSNESAPERKTSAAKSPLVPGAVPPVPFGPTRGVTVLSWGTISPLPGFHTASHIYPIGFTSQRTYTSSTDPSKRSIYINTIQEVDGKPVFRVQEQGTGAPQIEAASSGQAWQLAWAACSSPSQKSSPPGPGSFGYSLFPIARVLQELPGAKELTKYVFRTVPSD